MQQSQNFRQLLERAGLHAAESPNLALVEYLGAIGLLCQMGQQQGQSAPLNQEEKDNLQKIFALTRYTLEKAESMLDAKFFLSKSRAVCTDSNLLPTILGLRNVVYKEMNLGKGALSEPVITEAVEANWQILTDLHQTADETYLLYLKNLSEAEQAIKTLEKVRCSDV